MKHVMEKWAVTLVAVSMLCLVGCGGGEEGPKLVAAGGTVKYNGAAVEGATVTLVFDGGQTATGATGKDGTFTLTTNGRAGAPVGKAQVTVAKVIGPGADMGAAPKPEDMQKMMAAMKGQQGNLAAIPKSKNELPEKYNDLKGSGLSAEIPAAGVKDLLFDLKD